MGPCRQSDDCAACAVRDSLVGTSIHAWSRVLHCTWNSASERAQGRSLGCASNGALSCDMSCVPRYTRCSAWQDA
eukprot:1162584-Pleurochrysis_carterae.AAC.6